MEKYIIAILTKTNPHRSIGGLETYVKNLAIGLEDKGNQVEYFYSDRWSLNLHALFYRYFFVPFEVRVKYEKFLKNNKIDIIYAHDISGFSFSLFNSSIPLVYVFHSLPPLHGIVSFYKKIFEKNICRISNKLITVSEELKNEVIQRYLVNENLIDVISGGVDSAFFKPNDKEFGKIISVGRLGKEKNLNDLIMALKYVKNDFQLKIIGEGKEKINLQRLVFNNKLNDKIIFTGALFGEQLRREYATAEIFVFTSTHESFGLVLLEAMSSGCCVISTRIGVASRLIENGMNGFIYNSGDFKQLANFIDRLLSDYKLRTRISEKARKTVEKNYNWEKVVEKTMVTFKNALNRSRARNEI